ncbi:DUF7344 domain-containing protein [Halobacterium jilantaiense]|uniref:DUF7344 domain-containing protein n=1 Tax=Halobacterium jilantaiense TaxID=355548 RepID=A0A1I0PY29_9EURY|nr:hypothetical protein [Halobacterium jilantaiense]SEW19528.1 hypothetical protein SAMN04487945_2088 [Halobacterium jilantaiense]
MNDSHSKSQEAHALDESALHDLLSSERRRHALDCLTEHGPMALPDLADEVADREHDEPLPQVPEDAVLTIYLSLYHTHVPKLQTAGVVDYDQDRDLVALADDAGTLDAYAARDSVVGAD